MNLNFDIAAIATLVLAFIWKYVADERKQERSIHRIEIMEKQMDGLQKTIEELKNLVHSEQLATRKIINDGFRDLDKSINEVSKDMAVVKVEKQTARTLRQRQSKDA